MVVVVPVFWKDLQVLQYGKKWRLACLRIASRPNCMLEFLIEAICIRILVDQLRERELVVCHVMVLWLRGALDNRPLVSLLFNRSLVPLLSNERLLISLWLNWLRVSLLLMRSLPAPWILLIYYLSFNRRVESMLLCLSPHFISYDVALL